MATCTYTFKDKSGSNVTLAGIPALKAYLVMGGLEQFGMLPSNLIMPTKDNANIDSEYFNAINNGDMETAQRLVNEAAQKAGVPIINEDDVTAYKVRRNAPPKKTTKAYKLFRVKKTKKGEIFALFVGAQDPLPKDVWLDATAGAQAPDSITGKAKVKSKIGNLAYRPGWHAGDIPLATHIGAKDEEGNVFARKDDEVWAEVEMADDVDYQPEADANGTKPDGKFVVGDADIKYMPTDGLYRYKTNANMTGKWIISGSMKINRILSENEVNSILKDAEAVTMPWSEKKKGSKVWTETNLNLSKWGLDTNPAENQKKLLDPVTYDDNGNVIPLSKRFDRTNNDIRFSIASHDWATDLRTNISNSVLDRMNTDKKFNWWHKTVGTQSHKAVIDKDFRKVYNASMAFEQDTAKIANRNADKAPSLLPKIEGLLDAAKELKKGYDRIKDAKAVSTAIFQTTLQDKTMTEQELITQGLTDNQRVMYHEFFNAVNNSLDDLAKSEMYRSGRVLKLDKAPDNLNLKDTSNWYANQLDDHNDQKQFIDKYDTITKLQKQGYAPLMRFGQYTLDVVSTNPDGSTKREFFGMFESPAEVNKAKRTMAEMYPSAQITSGIMSQKDWQMFKGVTPETMEIFARLMNVEQGDAFQEYLKHAVNNKSAMKRLIHRNKIEGFAGDPQRVLATFITSNAKTASKNYHMGDMVDAIASIPKEKGDVLDEAIDLYNYVQNPSEAGAKIRGWLFAWYLGGSPAAAMINLTQTFTTTLPYLSKFGNASQVIKELANAMKLATKPINKIGGDLGRALKLAEDEGVTAPHELHMLYGESIRTGFMTSPLLRPLSKAWGTFFSLAESYNRRVAFIAAYNLAKQNNEASPFKFAERAVDKTQFVYCVDTETECLTLDGWKKHDELSNNDILISINDEGKTVESKLVNVHLFNGKHDVIKFSNGRKFSMVLTHEHDCIIQNYDSKRKKYCSIKKVKANNLKNHNQLLRSPLLPINRNISNYGENLALLLGWVAAEGSYHRFRNCKAKHNVRITQSIEHNPKYVEEIENILISLGGHYKKFIINNKNHKNMVTFTIKKPLSEVILKKMPDKLLTYEMLKDMNVNEMKSLILAFSKGDGHYNKSSWIITQKQRINLDIMQAMRVLCAESSTIYENKNYNWSSLYLNNGKRSEVSKLDREYITIDNVWCPETEYGTWIARRNGAVFVTGNSKTARSNLARGTVGSMLMTFKTFSTNYLEFLVELPTRERTIALAVLITMAGLSGLPGADDIDDILDTLGQSLGYNTNSKEWKNEVITDMISYIVNDRSTGKSIANYIMNGVSAGLPMDISSRLSVGNLIPGSAVLKRSEIDKSRDVMEFIGPVGSLASRVKDSAMAIGSRGSIEGKVYAAGKAVMPKALQDIAQAMDMEQTGKYRNFKGANVVDVSTGDALVKALGFQPTKVSEPRKAERLFNQNVQMAKVTEGDIASLWAIGVVEKNQDKIREAKQMLADWNRHNPDTPIRIKTRQIAQRVRELRRTSAERLLKSTPKELREYARKSIASANE